MVAKMLVALLANVLSAEEAHHIATRASHLVASRLFHKGQVTLGTLFQTSRTNKLDNVPSYSYCPCRQI